LRVFSAGSDAKFFCLHLMPRVKPAVAAAVKAAAARRQAWLLEHIALLSKRFVVPPVSKCDSTSSRPDPFGPHRLILSHRLSLFPYSGDRSLPAGIALFKNDVAQEKSAP